MIYLRRQTICDRLRLSNRQSYRIVGSSYGERISSDDVLEVLNRSRRAIDGVIGYIPSDLMTPFETTIRFADSEITEHELFNWSHRTKNQAPHFRLNSHTIRFSARLLSDWLESRSKIRSRS